MQLLHLLKEGDEGVALGVRKAFQNVFDVWGDHFTWVSLGELVPGFDHGQAGRTQEACRCGDATRADKKMFIATGVEAGESGLQVFGRLMLATRVPQAAARTVC